MKNLREKPLPEDIERLIAEEESAAMARFRGSDFAPRLKGAIAVAGHEAPAPLPSRRIPGWTWAAAGVLTAAAILAYIAVPKRGPSRGAAEEKRTAFVRLPGLEEMELWAKDAALAPAPLSRATSAFAAALARMKAGAATAESVGIAPTEQRVPHLGLEKLMEILIRDKAVEKTLSLVSPKIKEG